MTPTILQSTIDRIPAPLPEAPFRARLDGLTKPLHSLGRLEDFAAQFASPGITPAIRPWLFAAHRSHEPGHRILLQYLGLNPVLDLQMRLGEASGAVLAMPVLESALALYNQMATFTSAGFSKAGA